MGRSLFAGSNCGYADATTPAKALFSTLGGLAFDGAGNLFVADSGNQRVREVAADGTVSTVAGNGRPATSSPIYTPSDVAVDAAGNLYIADRYNYCIRKVTPDGIIATVAGTPQVFGNMGDGGPATLARLGTPLAVKVDADGSLWVADSNHVVRRVAPDGIISTVAGTGSPGFASEGPAWASALFTPSGLAVTPNGVYVADSGSGRVRLLTRPVSSQ